MGAVKKMSYKRSRGVSGYANSGDWTWEHWPPPFTQWGPANPSPQPSPYLGGGGLGCSSCSGGCGDPMGLGQTSDGLFGTGLFESMNPSTWGVGEYVVGGIGVWIVGSAISDVTRVGAATGRAASKGYRKGRRAVKGTGSVFAGISGFVLTAGLIGGAYYLYTQYSAGGLGDYQAQGYATPQILNSPGRNSQLQIPVGW
jgi:hypothetical protein